MVPRRPKARVIRTSRDAEAAARDWMIYFGHQYARLTVVGPDMGVDVVTDSAVAQVKAGLSRTGRPVVQQIYGAAELEGKDAYLFTVGGVTNVARDWANRAGVALFRLDLSGDAFPVNVHAQMIMLEARRRGDGWDSIRQVVQGFVVDDRLGAVTGEVDSPAGTEGLWGIWHFGDGRVEVSRDLDGGGTHRVDSVDRAVGYMARQLEAKGVSARDCPLTVVTDGRRERFILPETNADSVDR